MPEGEIRVECRVAVRRAIDNRAERRVEDILGIETVADRAPLAHHFDGIARPT